MSTRMLIDARHPEETRVAVLQGNRIEEFDFESAEHKQIKGNIYLAKVTRVEPSLQAAFVDFGGNRHGFLAFSEIHPDYFQIPKEDRDALLREEAEAAAAAMRAEEEMESLEGEVEDVAPPAPLDEDGNPIDADDYDHDSEDRDGDDHDGDEERHDNHSDGDEEDESLPATDDTDDDAARDDEALRDDASGERRRGRGRRRPGKERGRRNDRGGDRGGDRPERSEEDAPQRRSWHRRYKIQDVIRRRQVLLVQVVKEERGNKGAALTTYLSLAGRYCVLMPNSSNGGGISRKISNGADRKRLKSIIDEMNLPPSMGCIVRTAGLERTKPEIRRDFDYLARLWDEIREKTLSATAPALIHSDSDLIKRAIRDIYNSDISDVIVEGEEGYRAAKDFMKLLMPSHARRVQAYSDPVSLFQRYGVEDQLSAMYQPLVPLKSGGYLIINPTEALVSIDVNSGRSTREHNIEQTALNTNLEAAYEVARQLRLRDMAGLVVIDFIDMESNSNVRKVERAMKDALKHDRARIQLGRISGFGLMEMSRQRLRTGVLEASTRQCPHCDGTGLVRTAASAGLGALRLLEEEAARGRGSQLLLRASQEAAFYVLNNKRAELTGIEDRYGVRIDVQSDGHVEGARMSVDASGPPPAIRPQFTAIADEPDDDIFDEEIEGVEAGEGGEEGTQREDGDRSRRRRRRRRGGRRDDEAAPREQQDDVALDDGEPRESADSGEDAGEAEPADDRVDNGERDEAEPGDARRRRRGRRGGRNRRSEGRAGAEDDEATASSTEEADAGDAPAPLADADAGDVDADAEPQLALPEGDAEPVTEEKPAAKPRRSRRKAADAASENAAPTDGASEGEADAEPAKKPRRSRKKVAETPTADAVASGEASDEGSPAEATAAEEAPAPKRRRSTRKTAASTAAKVSEAIALSDEDAAAPAAAAEPAEMADATAEPTEAPAPRRGWWQRTFGG